MHTRQFVLVALAALTSCATGCSTTPGNRFSFFSGGHKQLESAKELRAAVTEPVALPRELDKHVSPPFVVEPGDVLLVQPVDLDSPVRLPGDQAVLPDGTIQLGRYGRVIVAGKTLEEVESIVRNLIQTQTKDAGPVTARVVTRQSKVFYVLGEVNAPGSFVFHGRETVLDAILAAGGVTDRGSLQRVTLSRPTHPNGCRIVLPVCYSEIVQIGDTSTNYQIQAGDRIYIPTRTLREELSFREKQCPPCDKLHVPCYPNSGACEK